MAEKVLNFGAVLPSALSLSLKLLRLGKDEEAPIIGLEPDLY